MPKAGRGAQDAYPAGGRRAGSYGRRGFPTESGGCHLAPVTAGDQLQLLLGWGLGPPVPMRTWPASLGGPEPCPCLLGM